MAQPNAKENENYTHYEYAIKNNYLEKAITYQRGTLAGRKNNEGRLLLFGYKEWHSAGSEIRIACTVAPVVLVGIDKLATVP